MKAIIISLISCICHKKLPFFLSARVINIRYFLVIIITESKQAMRWMPATAGMTGRGHNRHFINEPIEQELFYRRPAFNPARNVYEFGLG